MTTPRTGQTRAAVEAYTALWIEILHSVNIPMIEERRGLYSLVD